MLLLSKFHWFHFLRWGVLSFSVTTMEYFLSTISLHLFQLIIKAKKLKPVKPDQGWSEKYHTDYGGYKSNTIKTVSVQMLELLNSVFPPNFPKFSKDEGQLWWGRETVVVWCVVDVSGCESVSCLFRSVDHWSWTPYSSSHNKSNSRRRWVEERRGEERYNVIPVLSCPTV